MEKFNSAKQGCSSSLACDVSNLNQNDLKKPDQAPMGDKKESNLVSRSKEANLTSQAHPDVSSYSSTNLSYSNCSGVPNNNGSIAPAGLTTTHYYAPILNASQSLLRPLMTTQPPLYSPILPPQQHSYAVPHPSPSSSFVNLPDSVRSSLESLSCTSDALFKEVTHQNRQHMGNNSGEKSFSMQTSKQYNADINQKRSNHQNASCNTSRFPSCGEAAKSSNLHEQQHVFEEYVRMYSEEGNCRGWGDATMSNPSSSTFQSAALHRTNTNASQSSGTSINMHGYSDCRLDSSWNRCIPGPSTSCNSDSYTLDNHVGTPNAKHLLKGFHSNTNIGTPVSEHSLARAHYEYQALSAGQLASILPYLQPLSYQQSQDGRAEFRLPEPRANETMHESCELTVSNEQSGPSSEVNKKQVQSNPPAHPIPSIASSSAASIPQEVIPSCSSLPTTHSIPSNHLPLIEVSGSSVCSTSHSIPLVANNLLPTNHTQPQEIACSTIQNSSTKVAIESKRSSSDTTQVPIHPDCSTMIKDQTSRANQEDYKKRALREIGSEGSIGNDYCLLCGTAVEVSTHCLIDSLITVPSKISVSEKLTLITGYPLPRDMLPSLSVCPKCFHLINEVDVLEHRLKVCRREVLLSIEAMFERNGIPISPYKRFQRQQYGGSYQHHDMQHTAYQQAGSNPLTTQNPSSQASYQNDLQNYQSLNYIYSTHGQTNQTHLTDQTQMPQAQSYQHHSINMHSTPQAQVNHIPQNHMHNRSQVHHHDIHVQQQHHAQLVHSQDHSSQQHQQLIHHQSMHIAQLKDQHIQNSLNKVSQESDHHKQQQLLNHQHTHTHQHVQQQHTHNPNNQQSSLTHQQQQSVNQLSTQGQHPQPHTYRKQQIQVSFHNQPILEQQSQHPVETIQKHHFQHSNSNLISQELSNGLQLNSHLVSKSDPIDQSQHIQPASKYQQHILPQHTSSKIETLPAPVIERSITTDLHQSPLLAVTLQRKENDKKNHSEAENILLEASHQVPLIIPETSDPMVSHPMSVLLSPYAQNEPREYNADLLSDSFDHSYSHPEEIDHNQETDIVQNQETEIVPNQQNKIINEPVEVVNSSKEHFPTDTQNSEEAERWNHCQESVIESIHASNSNINHADCDIDIEKCDNFIEAVTDKNGETPPGSSCNNISHIMENQNVDVALSDQHSCVNSPFKNESNESDSLCAQVGGILEEVNVSEEQEINPISPPENGLDILLSHSSPPSPPSRPSESLRNVQDATEYHKPTLLGKNIKAKKHAKLQICRQCDQVFSNRQALIRHIERRHKSCTVSHSCDTCHKKFNSERTLKHHIQSHTTYSCKLCDKIFPKKSKLKKHMTEHSQESLICKVCNKKTSSMQALISHVKTHDRVPKIFVCSICSKNFACKRNLDHHSRIHTGEKSFICENCGQAFRHRSNMITHNKLCIGKFGFVCVTCGRGFVLKSLYERHIAEHEGHFAHSCSLCHKGFSKSSDLRYHFATHGASAHAHPNPCVVCSTNTLGGCNSDGKFLKSKKVVCEICGKSVSRKDALQDHLSQHSGKREHHCSHCSATFCYRSNLSFHIKTVHLKKRPFSCSLCHKAFSRAGSFKLHMRTHTGERPFQCKSCGKAFTSNSNYKRHLKCHVTHAPNDG